MKGKAILTGVVALHVAGLGLLVGLQGCGTARPQPQVGVTPPPPPPLPPKYEAQAIPTGPGVRRAPAAIVAPAPVAGPIERGWSGETTEYVVQKGDSISVIAKRYNVPLRALVELNGLADANLVRVGQKLLLPGKVDLAKPREIKPVTRVEAAAPGAGQIIVRKGDTLSGLAQRHGTTVKALREANKLTDDRILVGQALSLPQGAKQTAAPAPAPAAVGGTTAARAETPMSPAAAAPAPLPPASAATVAVTQGDEFLTHTVGPDEDIYGVALHYTVLPDDVKRWNNLSDFTLRPGQKLRIKVPQTPNR